MKVGGARMTQKAQDNVGTRGADPVFAGAMGGALTSA